jgi:hypothetical protein
MEFLSSRPDATTEGGQESQSRLIAESLEHASTQEDLTEGWDRLGSYMQGMGFEEKETANYLSSLMLHHGQDILVRRAPLVSAFESIEKDVPLPVRPLDAEPNAALLGNGRGEETGIGVALTGGFGWFADSKVAGAYGFIPNHSHLQASPLRADSLSHAKKGSELMRRVEGEIEPSDFLFFIMRAHRSAFPEGKLKEEDYDEVTGEVKPFILRVYGKSRQAQ